MDGFPSLAVAEYIVLISSLFYSRIFPTYWDQFCCHEMYYPGLCYSASVALYDAQLIANRSRTFDPPRVSRASANALRIAPELGLGFSDSYCTYTHGYGSELLYSTRVDCA